MKMSDEFSLSDIQDAEYRAESQRDLQELPDGLYQEARGYIRSLDSERRRESAENALQTLAEARYDKLRERVTLGVSVDERMLTDEERKIHEKLQNGGVDRSDAVDTLVTVEEGQQEVKGKTGRVDRIQIRITEDEPEFVGTDDREYDLDEGDVVALPKLNAEAMLKWNSAKRVFPQGDEEDDETAGTNNMNEGLAKAMGGD
jgi:DNA replication initiation complex subunit (GINS family)